MYLLCVMASCCQNSHCVRHNETIILALESHDRLSMLKTTVCRLTTLPSLSCHFSLFLFLFSLFCHTSTEISCLAVRKTYFDDTNLNGVLRPHKRKDLKMVWLMALVTWSAAKLARSLKATPTGNCINPELGWSNSLPSLFKAFPEFQRTTSAVLVVQNRSERPRGLTKASPPCAP